MEGGTSVYRRDLSGGPALVDTTSLVMENNRDFVQNARDWVSSNSLRQLLRKRIFVVCVLTSSGPNDPVHKEPDFRRKKFTWLHLLSYMFKEHQLSMMMLVKTIGTDHSEAIKSGIRDVLQRGGFARSNIRFETFEEDTILATVTSIVGHSRDPGTPRNSLNTMGPFSLREVKSTAEEKDANGPWGPLQVILLRREGNGKSSCAQMLTSGRLDPDSDHLPSGSCKQSMNFEPQRFEGRGWDVLDTPGVLDLLDNDKLPDIGRPSIRKKLEKIVARLFLGDTASLTSLDRSFREFAKGKGIPTLIYAWSKDRIDELDITIWRMVLQFFRRLNANSSLTVLVLGADEDWVRLNIDNLQACFTGCESILGIEFPPVKTDDDELEEDYQSLRMQSLTTLEDRLAFLSAGRTVVRSQSISREESKLQKLLLTDVINTLGSSHAAGNSSRTSGEGRPSNRYT
ncbi:unnamed protein product [Calypogeia fissa]